MLKSFENFYNINEYKQLVENFKKYNSQSNEINQELNNSEKIFLESIIQYLKHRVSLGLLKIPKNSETHSSILLEQLKSLVEKKENQNLNRVDYLFFKIMYLYGSHKIENNAEIEKRYQELIQFIDKGDFNVYDLECDSVCFGCDKKMKLMSKNWNFLWLVLEKNNENKYNFVPLEPCIDNNIKEIKIEFKTGELLIADWFRIPEFTEQVEYNEHPSISSRLGKLKLTEHAAKLGFITIHVGNSSPNIYEKEGELFFGHQDFNKPKIKSYNNLGYVCTDLWNTTIIEKDKLIEIIAKKIGKENANHKVEEYIQNNKRNINFINVVPGNYIVQFKPGRNLQNLDSSNKNNNKELKTVFLIKPELPIKNNKPKIKF